MKVAIKTAFFLICSIALYGQDETIDLEFTEADPIWRHVVSDTTFEELTGQPYWTKYSSLTLNIVERKQDELFLLATSRTPRQSPDYYGFVLEKIDFYSGQPIWKHHNTQYNGGNQDFYKRLHYNNDGDVDLIGVEPYEHGGGQFNWSLGAYPG